MTPPCTRTDVAGAAWTTRGHRNLFGQSDEFVELYNPLGQAVSLFDDATGLGWRLRGLSRLDGEPGFELPAGVPLPTRVV